ncbi:hypothetical protein L1987_17572 [Smallanthus sonchifolius]|uniref:Uncharacterized protein n=1 Tax=Smallanthus sonchifolius TaxID=185202 RepID=A0ACB9IX62_9ASTR|nr:hypothetical protein L1987_17572 [Smallanthus sonchifolius]
MRANTAHSIVPAGDVVRFHYGHYSPEGYVSPSTLFELYGHGPHVTDFIVGSYNHLSLSSLTTHTHTHPAATE